MRKRKKLVAECYQFFYIINMETLESIRDENWNAWILKHNADEARKIAQKYINTIFRDKVS